MTTKVSFSPGEILRDELDERGWTSAEFAQILGRPAQVVSEILNDRKAITTDTAVEIAAALGTSPQLWLNLQMNYRLRSSDLPADDLSKVERRARLRSLVPVRELINRQWLPDTKDLDELESATCNLLNIETITDEPTIRAAARKSDAEAAFAPEQLAWLARVSRLGAERALPQFDRDSLGRLAADLPSQLQDPFELENLEEALAMCGVALVCEMPLRSSKMDGAVVWDSAGPPVLALSTRGNRFDSFLFTLLHEMAHLWCEHVTPGISTIDEDLEGGPTTNEQELEANEQATLWLFPQGFIAPTGRITISTVLDLASVHRVHPSVIIGRLQKDGHLDWSKFRARIPGVRDKLSSLGGA